jgi:hypothetical protein
MLITAVKSFIVLASDEKKWLDIHRLLFIKKGGGDNNFFHLPNYFKQYMLLARSGQTF